MSILDDEIILKVENAEKNLRAIIDITAGEIYQAVEDGDNETRGYIDTKADQILAQVDDMAQELTGLINVQAGAVTALVEGGGAAGEMSLSLNLPIMITAATRAQLVQASTEAKVAAVYALIENTTYYGIKGNASNAAVKALWNDAIAGGLLASQIVLSADQIQLAGKTIFTSAKTNEVAGAAAAAAQSAAITAAAADATEKANAAQSAAITTAATDATSKADAAQSAAEATAEANRKALINAISQSTSEGETVIDGGYLKTALIDVENILTKNIAIKDKGVIHSDNYNGTIDANGNITGYGSAGWAIDHNGKADINTANIQCPTRNTHVITTYLIEELYDYFLNLDIDIANYNPYNIKGEFIHRNSNTSQYVFNAQYLYKSDSNTFDIKGQLYTVTNGQIVEGQMRGDLQYYGRATLEVGLDDYNEPLVRCYSTATQEYFTTRLDFQAPCSFSF